MGGLTKQCEVRIGLLSVGIEPTSKRFLVLKSRIHFRAGFSANAMVVWRVPEERSEEVGLIMATSPHVTHCYERPTYDDWPYSHYTMIHAGTEAECEAIAEEIAEQIAISDRQLIYSTREYKKTRVRYFV